MRLNTAPLPMFKTHFVVPRFRLDLSKSVNPSSSLYFDILFQVPQESSRLPYMEAKPFTVDEYVRWSDVDRAGIIFYGAYVRFFEIAETELFRAAGIPYGRVFDEFDIWLPRVHLDCDFQYPARLDDRLRVAAYFTRFGTSSIAIAFDVLHLGAKRLAAMGHEILVCVDRAAMKPRAIPDGLRALLEPYCFAEEAARRRLRLEVEQA